MNRHSQVKDVLPYTSIHPTKVQRGGEEWSVGRKGPGKDSQRKPPPQPPPHPPSILLDFCSARSPQCPWESWTTLPSLLCMARREYHGDAEPSTVLEKPEWQECCSLRLSHAETWPTQKVGSWAWGWLGLGAWLLFGRLPGRRPLCQARPGLERPSLTPGSPQSGLVSAEPAPRSWLGSDPGSRPR